MKHLIPLAVLLMASAPLFGQTDVQTEKKQEVATFPFYTDRPGFSESPFLVPKKFIQVESGFNYEFNADQTSRSSAVTYNSTMLKYGLSDRLELRASADYQRQNTYNRLEGSEQHTAGLLPVLLGAKLVVLQQGQVRPALSFIGYLQVPVAAQNNQAIAPLLKLTAQQTLWNKVNLLCNVGSRWNGYDPAASAFYTLSVGSNFTEKLGFFVEGYGYGTTVNTLNQVVDGGFTYLIRPTFQVDVSAGLGLTEGASDGFLNCGISWRLPRN